MKKRNFGLDVMRAIAILLVLANHIFNYFVTFHFLPVIADISGTYGVEIFFVLSGFLIGGILFRDVLPRNEKNGLKIFYIRRWLRTLPLYYLLLIIFVVIDNLVYKKGDLHLLHFIFLQNFSPASLHFFSVSWSLAIEEWFYLLLPIAFLLLYRKTQSAKSQLVFLCLSILGIVCMRVLFISYVHTTYDTVRKIIPLRFDSLLIGVLLAWIKINMHTIYKELQKPSRVAVISIILAVSLYTHFIFYIHHQLDSSHFIREFSLPFMSVLFAALLPFLEAGSVVNISLHSITFFRSFFTNVSLLSYSLYLTHLEVFDMMRLVFRNKIPSLLILPIALCITFFVSYLLYTYFEKPIMDMRKNFT